MNFKFSKAGIYFQMNTENYVNIAIPLKFNAEQPNHFGADKASKQTLKSGDFIGDVNHGGSCNVDSITMVPHCNGTHTESIGHIVHQKVPIGKNFANSLSLCKLITINPKTASKTTDNYHPELEKNDKVIDLNCLKSAIGETLLNQIESLVIRTLPNNKEKICKTYDEDNLPPFFTNEAMNWLAQSGIKHLLVDMPSIDKMYDDGILSNHHIYWKIKNNSRLLNDHSVLDRTITEMVYVDNSVRNGLYCLNLQLPAFQLDAAPSRPILYPLTQIQP